MHTKIAACLIIIVLAVAACVPRSGQSPVSTLPPSGPEARLFQQAQDQFQDKAFDRAIGLYSRYLDQYPRGLFADRSLLRIADIYKDQGANDAAHAFYQRLVVDFPQSTLADVARLSIIDLLILDDRPGDAIDLALQMLSTDLDAQTRRQLLQRLSRQYQAAGSMGDAAVYGYMLYKALPDDEKEQAAAQLIQTINGLDADDIEVLWPRVDDDLIRSYLMYRYAVVQTMQENYDDALEVLTAFKAAYPDHPNAQQAIQLMETLHQHLAYAPNTIGCLLPLSGPYKLYGQRALNGIELALNLMQVGEQPVPVKLVIEDSASQDDQAVQGVRALADSRVGAIIGPIITATAAAREAQRLNIPMVTFTQKPGVPAIGDYIFRHFITPQNQVSSLVDYFVHQVGLRDFAILYPKEAYGRTFMTLFWDEVVRQGGRITGVEAYDPKQTDFAVQIKKLVGAYYPLRKDLKASSVVKIKENPYYQQHAVRMDRLEDLLPDPVTRLAGLFFQDPDQDRVKGPAIGRKQQETGIDPIIDFDVLFIPDAPKAAGMILPQLAFYDVRDIYLAGTNLWHSPQLIEMTQAYAQSAVMVDGFFKESQSDTVMGFVETYKSIYQKEPGLIEAFAFDTARVLLDIISQPDMQYRHTLRNVLQQVIEVEGVTGSLAFDEEGEAVKNLSLLQVKGKRFIEIPRQ